MYFRPPTSTAKPPVHSPINSPTNSGQSGSIGLSDVDDSDEEVGFYSDDDFDDDDDDDGGNLWKASSPVSDEDNITYESLVRLYAYYIIICMTVMLLILYDLKLVLSSCFSWLISLDCNN